MSFAYHQNYVVDEDGFRRPDLGGTVAVKYASFTFSDDGLTLFTLPRGAVVTDFSLNVTEAFDAATSTVVIEVPGTSTVWCDDTDVTSTGLTRAGAATTDASLLFNAAAPAAWPVQVSITAVDATEGAATFSVTYIIR